MPFFSSSLLRAILPFLPRDRPPAPARTAPAAGATDLAPGSQRRRDAPARPGGGCHNGMRSIVCLADLKQQAWRRGVSHARWPRPHYLVYDQSIVNRDRGQRVFARCSPNSPQPASERRCEERRSAIKMHAAAFAARREGISACRRR
jgi:hypothetical protein